MVPSLQVFLPIESNFTAFFFFLSKRGLKVGVRTCSVKIKRKCLLLTKDFSLKEKKFQMMKYQAGKVQVDRSAAVQRSFPGAVIPS